MPMVVSLPRTESDGSVITQFNDSIDTTGRTYSYPNSQNYLEIWNKGYTDIILNVGNYNPTIHPNQKWSNNVTYDSFTINSINDECEVLVTAKINNNNTDLAEVKEQLASIANYQTVTASNNTYTLDLSKNLNFDIETQDTNAKTLAFSNVPTTANLILSIGIKLKYTNASAITFPASVIWQNGTIPTFTVGKQYLLMVISYDGGATWLGYSAGAW
jgi:hypothetical protein